MKNDKKHGVILIAGAVILSYILGKTNGSLKTLEEIDKNYGKYFPENTEVKVRFNKKLWASRVFNEK